MIDTYASCDSLTIVTVNAAPSLDQTTPKSSAQYSLFSQSTAQQKKELQKEQKEQKEQNDDGGRGRGWFAWFGWV